MSEPSVRAPEQIPADAYDPQGEGRDFRLLSQKAYNYIRKIQLEYLFRHDHKKSFRGVLWKEDHPVLEHSVVIGDMGETIALYDDKAVGQGAFGKVYAGVSCDTGKFHAVKLQPLRNDHQDHVTDIKHEIKVLSENDRLNDKLLLEEGNDFTAILCQEFAFGKNYFETIYDTSDKQKLSRNPLPFSEKLEMAIKALEAVKDFHGNNWLHCDLKLLNMMWDPINKEAKLIDFGTSREMNRGKYHEGYLCGTELYMAPEYLTSFNEDMTRFTIKGENYAMGMSLLQIFSNQILEKSPRNITVGYLMNKKSKGTLPFLEDTYHDVLGKEVQDKNLKKVAGVIKSLIDINPKNRPDLSKAIKSLKAIQKSYDKSIGVYDNEAKSNHCVICSYDPKKHEARMGHHSEEALRQRFARLMAS